MKDDKEKTRMDLLPWAEVADIADIMTFGAKKYDAYNWTTLPAYGRLSAAMMRHMAAWMSGEDTDPESGKSHLAHAGANVLMLMWMQKNQPEKDDRYKKGILVYEDGNRAHYTVMPKKPYPPIKGPF